ncbi:hypothetical protein ACFQ0B_31770 [Nonomuraea thailandensis]
MQLWLALVLAAGVLTAPADVPRAAAPDVGRQAEFAAAAREHGVPESVLLAVAYLESRWDANGGGRARRAVTGRCTWWTRSPATYAPTVTPPRTQARSSGTRSGILAATTPGPCPPRSPRPCPARRCARRPRRRPARPFPRPGG